MAEFEELHSPVRRADTQGGGVHGQALLSRYSLEDARALVHSHQPVDWDAEGCVTWRVARCVCAADVARRHCAGRRGASPEKASESRSRQ